MKVVRQRIKGCKIDKVIRILFNEVEVKLFETIPTSFKLTDTVVAECELKESSFFFFKIIFIKYLL
jgi:hypothetical protein